MRLQLIRLFSLFFIVFLVLTFVVQAQELNGNIATLISFDLATYETEGINPYLWCPVCMREWQPHYKPLPILPRNYSVSALVQFKCPNCSYLATFYLGLYKADNYTAISISVTPIDSGWWNKTG